MSQAPSMPLYTDALLGDTLHLTAEEFGAYCLLLFATWRNNGRPLPDDDRKLARICRVATSKWLGSLRRSLEPFFDISNGYWRQGRLEKEWGYVAEKRALAQKNGARGGNAKALKSKKTGGSERSSKTPRVALAPNPLSKTPSESLETSNEVSYARPRARRAGARQKLSPIEGIVKGLADAIAASEARDGGADCSPFGALLDDARAGSGAPHDRRRLA